MCVCVCVQRVCFIGRCSDMQLFGVSSAYHLLAVVFVVITAIGISRHLTRLTGLRQQMKVIGTCGVEVHVPLPYHTIHIAHALIARRQRRKDGLSFGLAVAVFAHGPMLFREVG